MNSYIYRTSGGIGLACLLALWQAPSQSQAQEAPPLPGGADTQLEGGAEVLTRGPVHEAFAEPYSVSVEAPLTVDREPPEPINEVPPDVMPEGDDVEWIPGYWAWDDERSDFIWVSGLWRNVPPGQRWVPGSWAQAANGYQWSGGFWTSVETTDITYLPNPPANQEEGPNVAAPDDNHFWVPGSWRYVNNDYGWQPGYWAPAYEDWTWMPARYVWSPYGSVYCAGYWDYNPIYRGVLFSPVYFPNYSYPQFVPQNVISIGPMFISLFVRPQYGHYYFGNYYGSNFAQAGIVPWLGVGQYDSYRFDPMLSFYQTGYFNGNGGFLGRISGWHHYYRNHPDAQPAMTFADMRGRLNADLDPNVIRQASVTQSLDEFRRSNDRHMEMREVAADQRDRIQVRNKEFRDLQQQRRQMRLEGNEQTQLRLPPGERRARPEGIPERPDQDRQTRRSARPDQLDEKPNADQNRPADRPIREAPVERQNREGRDPVTDQPQPRERGSSDRSRERDSEGRVRRGRQEITFPDSPSNEGQEVQPIPRPSQQQRTEGRRGAPKAQERPDTRGSRQRGARPESPATQGQPSPMPNVNPPGGNRGNANPQGGNRGSEDPRGNPEGNRKPQPQGNPNAGREPSGQREPAQPGGAAGATSGQNRGGKKDRRP